MIKLRIQKGVFDLDTFESVTLVKEAEFEPVASTQDALARLGNDAGKFLAVINEGLEAETRRIAREDANDWRQLTEDDEINGLFEGTMADEKSVNSLVLTLAKAAFGYTKDSTKMEKKTAKQSAMEMIAKTDVIKQGLRRSAAK